MPTKKATKLDPKQEFIVRSYTREEIADELNEIIENDDLNITPFKGNDSRLTKKFCEEFVELTADAICQEDSLVDIEYACHHDQLVDEFGGTNAKEDE